MTYLVQEKELWSCGSAACLRSKVLTERFWSWTRSAPREARLATGRVVTALFETPEGLSKQDLVAVATGEDLSHRSIQYREALETAVNKRIQRARTRARHYGLNIVFDRQSQLWFLDVLSSSEETGRIQSRRQARLSVC